MKDNQLSYDELEALILNGDGPEYEQIQDSDNDPYYIIAILLDENEAMATNDVITKLINKIRNQ